VKLFCCLGNFIPRKCASS